MLPRFRNFFQESDVMMFITHESDSILAAESNLKKIIEAAADRTIENFYNSIMPDHAMGLLKEMIETTFEIYLLQGETNINHVAYNRSDAEPVKINGIYMINNIIC